MVNGFLTLIWDGGNSLQLGNLVLENGDAVKEMSMETLLGIHGREAEERMGEGSGEERRLSCHDVSET